MRVLGGPGPRTHPPSVQDLNSAITYRVTNNSDFRMEGEVMLTAAPLLQTGVFYAEVRGRRHLPGPGVRAGLGGTSPFPAPG